MLIRVAVMGVLPLAGSPGQEYCRETHNALLHLKLFSLTVHLCGHQWHYKGRQSKSTRDCRFLWPKVEKIRVQVLFSSIIQLSGKDLSRT